MVVFLSPPGTQVPFGEKYGVLYFPILADITMNALFRRKVSSLRIPEAAGVAAGVAAFAVFSQYTSKQVGLLGAGFFLAWKVCHYFYLALSEFYLSGGSLAKASIKALDKFIIEFEDDGSEEDQKVQNFIERKKETIRALYDNPNNLIEILAVLQQAQAILFHKFSSLQDQTTHLVRNPVARNQQMSRLLEEAHRSGDVSFKRALTLLNQIYRFIRGQYYYIRFPDGFKEQNPKIYYTKITDGKPFITGSGLQHQMNLIYNQTHEKLKSLLEISLYDCESNVKDEKPIPGDLIYHNTDNPFKVGHQDASKPLEENPPAEQDNFPPE